MAKTELIADGNYQCIYIQPVLGQAGECVRVHVRVSEWVRECACVRSLFVQRRRLPVVIVLRALQQRDARPGSGPGGAVRSTTLGRC